MNPLPNRRVVLGAGLAGLSAAAGCRAPATGARDVVRSDEPDEPFPGLSDQTHTGTPVTHAERAARRARLAALLSSEGTDALLVEPGATLDYLTGVGWGLSERLFALVALADGTHFWICPTFERPKAELAIGARADAGGTAVGGEIETWDEHEYASLPLAAALRDRGVANVAVDPRCRFFVADRLSAAFGRSSIRSGENLVRELRGRKDAHEIALLRRANELTQQAIVAASEALREGMTGAEIASLMRRAQERLGLSRVWTLALVGPAAAFPHGEEKAVPLRRGDVVLVDTGGSFHGYQSDITRTWVFGGEPSAEVVRVWNVVRDAQKRAFEALRPGVRCGDVDQIARTTIANAGFGSGYEHFTHRLGHGIGLEGHEEPYLDSGNDLLLAPGMTFSDEPGIYLYGRFGVRIEDIATVVEGGAEVFGTWQRSPASPA